MNLRSTIFLALACAVAPAVAGAHSIPASPSLDSLAASPVAYLLTDGQRRVATTDESVGATPDHSTDRLRDRWEVKGIPDVRLHLDGQEGDVAPASTALLTADSTTSVVSVPEPATLGLMGLALAMLSLGKARLRGSRLQARSLGASR